MQQPFNRVFQALKILAAMQGQTAIDTPKPIYFSRGKSGKTPATTNHAHMRYVRKQLKLKNKRKHK